jgi:hypothetical protein
MDNYGRIARDRAANSEPKHDYGRPWTGGSALHNRRLQVRFLSHLPETLNLCRLQASRLQLILRALTPFDPNGSNIGSHVSDAQLIDALARHKFQRSFSSQ